MWGVGVSKQVAETRLILPLIGGHLSNYHISRLANPQSGEELRPSQALATPLNHATVAPKYDNNKL